MSDRLERLVVLRDQLTVWLAGNAPDRAQLALRLVSVLEQIEAIEKAQPATEGTVLDEVSARRAASGSPGSSGRRFRR
jgi:hypothetical protein